MDRRTFLGQLAAAAAVSAFPETNLWAQQVPNSVGTARPRMSVPVGACDCHHHIYDAVRFPPSDPTARSIPNATVDEYRQLQRRLGITRHVVVTPAPYVGDNRVTVDALRQFGAEARGVALLRPGVTDMELKALHVAGIRGVRFSLGNPGLGNPSSIADIEPLSKRVWDLGWHVQIYMRADQIAPNEALLSRVENTVVFDHMGVLLPAGTSHAAFAVMRRMIDKGRTWVKLSAPFQQAKLDAKGNYVITYGADVNVMATVAKAFIQAAPERMLWGSNWPHPGEFPSQLPDDAAVMDLLPEWEPREAVRRRILVENPETLYGFPKERG